MLPPKKLLGESFQKSIFLHSEATGTGISASGFKDFLLKSELLQALLVGPAGAGGDFVVVVWCSRSWPVDVPSLPEVAGGSGSTIC